MKFSVVTISYNQAQYIFETLKSVIDQRSFGLNLEYIVVDPGSTDGSREIIDGFGDEVDLRIFDPDQGPADGLNRGFAQATGDIYCYLNSDDTFQPHALMAVRDWLMRHPDIDVVCGHGWAIDGSGARLRKIWSEPYCRLPVAYGASVQIQPSTFIRRSAFERTSGFNINNHCSWDGELLLDLFLSGAKFGSINSILSNYRLHEISITNSGRLEIDQRNWARRRFSKLMGREFNIGDYYLGVLWKMWKHIGNPRRLGERLFKGRMYKRGVK